MQRQVIDIPLGGLDQKTDGHLIEPPGLAVLKDGEFEEHGTIQTRKPFAEILDSASNTISNIRRIYQVGDEFIAFSKGAIWSYAEGDGLWTQRAEHLAVDVAETPRFVRSGEQYDCDRAEHSGVVFYCWTEDTQGGTKSYVAAIDKETGAVKLAPEEVRTGAVFCKLIATTNSVMLVYHETTTTYVREYDPIDLSSSETSTAHSNAACIDACLDPNTPTQIWVVTSRASRYSVQAVPEGLTVTVSTSRVTTVSGAIAIAYDSDNDEVGITFNNGTAIISDFYTSALASVNTAIATGTAASATVNQIAMVYEGGGIFRAFWSAGQATDSTEFAIEANTVQSDTTTGTEAEVIVQCGIASRAFRHDSATYLWVAFAAESQGDITAQLQNGYFLIRADGHIAAKAVSLQAGGFPASTGFLPGVANTTGNAWALCGQYRGVVPLAEDEGQRAYSAKSPQDVVFEFDSDKARRVAVLGETAYVSGGIVRQYDGKGLYEVGFHYFPFDISIVSGGGGSNLNGTYSWKQVFAWPNARGEVEESTTTTVYAQGISTNSAQIIGTGLTVTAKQDAENDVEIRWYRQEDSAADGAPYFQVSSLNPAATGSNDFVENDPTAILTTTFVDNYADATLVAKRPYYENGGIVLANLPPPGARIIKETQDRILLAGIPANPNRIVYSKLRGQGEVAAFNDGLYLDLPPEGGAITALGFLNETLIAFKESAVYAIPGDGYDNTGSGQNYGPGRLLASDVGATSAESVALTPRGLIFKSSKGWYLLNQGWQAQYIGGPVEDYDGDTVRCVHLMESQHQVRILTDARLLVWDYLVNQWAEWTIDSGIDACVYDGTYHYTDGTKVYSQRTDWSAENGPSALFSVTRTAGNSTFIADNDATPVATLWPKDGWALLGRGTANEELLGYTDLTAGTFYVAAEDSYQLGNNHSAGETIELTWRTALNGAASAGASSITVDALPAEYEEAADWPTTGRLLLSEGLAAEEEIEYTAKAATSFTLASALQNNHADNAIVRLMLAEPAGLDIETGWIHIAGIQGFKRLRRLYILGKYKGPHRLRVRVAYNYDEAWVDDKIKSFTTETAGDPLQVEHGVSMQKCEAFKVRVTAIAEYGGSASAGYLPPSNEALSITGMTAWLGVKPTAYKGLSSSQKQ